MPEQATTTTPNGRHDKWGHPVPAVSAESLRRMTQTITDAEREWDERAALMSELHMAGYSFDAIATAAGITREGARKTVVRWARRATRGAPAPIRTRDRDEA